jgi:hypothetical protein
MFYNPGNGYPVLTDISASGKIILIFMLFCFTFVTMVRKTSDRSHPSTTNKSGRR